MKLEHLPEDPLKKDDCWWCHQPDWATSTYFRKPKTVKVMSPNIKHDVSFVNLINGKTFVACKKVEEGNNRHFFLKRLVSSLTNFYLICKHWVVTQGTTCNSCHKCFSKNLFTFWFRKNLWLYIFLELNAGAKYQSLRNRYRYLELYWSVFSPSAGKCGAE